MKFRDFIGNEITLGCYCAYPGRGNVDAEYGMILYKVLGFDEDKHKLKLVRLDVNGRIDGNQFPDIFKKNAIITKTSSYTVAVRFLNSTVENTNKLAVVTPNEIFVNIFDKVLAGDDSLFNEIKVDDIGSWIHGTVNTLVNNMG